MRNREIEKYKKTLFLSKRQREILIGTLLGDGHLEKHTPTLGRLKIEQTYKQKDYVDWIYKEFKNWVRTKPRERQVKAFGKTYEEYEFSTYGHKILGEFRERFYKGSKKIIPNDLEKNITPLGLAIWYMDDGSIKSKRHKGVFLNTQGFEVNDIKKLQKYSKINLELRPQQGIKKEIKRVKKQIYLGGSSGEKFINLIESYIIPSMRYKIPKVLRLTELPKE